MAAEPPRKAQGGGMMGVEGRPAGGTGGAASGNEGTPAVEAVLFDLDGTLLDVDGEGFLDAYVEQLTAEWAPQDVEAFRHLVMAAAVPIFSPHPEQTTGEVFRTHLARHLGSTPQAVAERMARVDQRLPETLRFPYRQRAEARDCVQECLAMGLRVAVATTPLYAPSVIALRLRWAGLDDLPWSLITHSENMHTCKPDPAYFAEAAQILGLPPSACLMVGDDPLQDGPAAAVGMRVLLPASDGRPGWQRLDDVLQAVGAFPTARRQPPREGPSSVG